MVTRWTTQAQVDGACHQPPQTTRAKLRGEFITQAVAVKAPFSVDWVRLKVNRPEPQMVELLDPFAAENPEVDDLIKYMDTHVDSFRELS